MRVCPSDFGQFLKNFQIFLAFSKSLEVFRTLLADVHFAFKNHFGYSK